MQRGQHAMPCAAMQVDALAGGGDEGGDPARLACVIIRHDHQPFGHAHRDEGLRSFGVSFQQVEGIGQAAGFCLEDADAGAPLGPEIQLCAVMPATAEALVDDPIGLTLCLQYVTVCFEVLRRQGACRDRGLHRGLLWWGDGSVVYCGSDEVAVRASMTRGGSHPCRAGSGNPRFRWRRRPAGRRRAAT